MAKKKQTANDLILEIRRYSENAMSAGEDLMNLADEKGESISEEEYAELESLKDMAEHFDAEVHEWMDDSEAGKKAEAFAEKEYRGAKKPDPKKLAKAGAKVVKKSVKKK